MTKPFRVQLSREKGWRMPPNTVKVDRTTNWGNPYAARDYGNSPASLLVEMFRDFMRSDAPHARTMRERFDRIRGKNLACWCPLDQPCHADVLLELANAEEPRP